jgi:hypothetical protein
MATGALVCMIAGEQSKLGTPKIIGVPELFTNSFTPPLDFGVKSTAPVQRIGDLLNNMHISVTMPNIAPHTWISNVGVRMIKQVELELSGQTLFSMTGDNLAAFYELTLSTAKYAAYQQLQSLQDSNTIIIPLPFFQCADFNDELPLVALRQHSIAVHIELQPITKLINKLVCGSTAYPLGNGDAYHLNNADNGSARELAFYQSFLEYNMRNRITSGKPKKYLITQFHEYVPTRITANTKKVNITLSNQKAVKYLYWFYRSTNSELLNKYDDYTVGAVGAVGDVGAVGAVGDVGAVGAVGAVGDVGAVGAVGAVGDVGAVAPSSTMMNVGNSPITSWKLHYNGHDCTTYTSPEKHQRLKQYYAGTNTCNSLIYSHSYETNSSAVYDTVFKPFINVNSNIVSNEQIGYCNYRMIDNVQLVLTLADNIKDGCIYVYSVTYAHLVLQNNTVECYNPEYE